MRSILGKSLLATLLTLAPATVLAQRPALSYTSPVGAVTDISGGVYNPGITYVLEDGRLFDPCTPTVTYGNHGWSSDPPRHTGGDGVWTTSDTNPINSGGRTQSSYASADVSGASARAVVSADTSRPCAVYENGSLFMTAAGSATAQFYQAYTAASDPTGSQVDLNWRLQGSFSRLTSSGGGFARMVIYLLTAPPSQPVSDVPVIGGSLALVEHDITSMAWWGNVAGCALQHCLPVPLDPLIGTGGRIDLLRAFEAATGRPMTAGDSFTIGVLLTAWAQTSWLPDELTFTTDFSARTSIRSDVVFPQKQ